MTVGKGVIENITVGKGGGGCFTNGHMTVGKEGGPGRGRGERGSQERERRGERGGGGGGEERGACGERRRGERWAWQAYLVWARGLRHGP